MARDGSAIIYSRASSPLFDDALHAELHLLNSADGSSRQVTNNSVFESTFELSPDGTQVLFVADADETPTEHYYQGALFTATAEGGKSELVLSDFTPEVSSATWSKDGTQIYFTANTGVRVEIFSIAVASGEVTQVTNGDHAIYSIDYVPGIDRVAYLESTPHDPGILWVAAMAPFAPSDVHDPFAASIEQFTLARVEPTSWKGIDGTTVEGVLVYPVDYQDGQRYPLLAHTHGGPAASDKLDFDGYDQARAGRGYAILKPNFRGSTGYGNQVLRDMVGHYFHNAQHDVIAGVRSLVERGIADPDKLGTLGWSAGGHMTNWLITETDMFKAASSGAGAANWISMYSQCDVRIYRTSWFEGDPWHADSPLETYREHSPIFRIHRAKTPTLVFVGQNDERVPMPQSVELSRGLKANGVPTELVVFPRSGHGPRELRHRLYKLNKEFQWLEKFITGREFTFDEPPMVEKAESSEEEAKAEN